ncbi:hypothetical protein CEXT_530461 [Caerostris extrusa]|uniref:Uncharacterized protein n=1 Tax=Caerostris extrusa TaxID=172846 RepID=A0AAV4TUI3_CAEEX|nr:hypothetical protein CEXT_530461 [Caerostris extrusa]
MIKNNATKFQSFSFLYFFSTTYAIAGHRGFAVKVVGDPSKDVGEKKWLGDAEERGSIMWGAGSKRGRVDGHDSPVCSPQLEARLVSPWLQ